MFKILFLLGLASLAVCDGRLQVNAYIESQCPDCINFIKYSVVKSLGVKDIEKILDLRFVPYGNAKQNHNSDGTYSFTCQHGAIECHGNLLEVCALNNL